MVTVTVHPELKYQTGCILEANLHVIPGADIDDACERAVAIGVRQGRQEVQPKRIDQGGGVYDFTGLDANIDELTIPLDDCLRANGVEGGLRVNICNVPFGSDDNPTHVDPDVYAAYVVATVEHVQERMAKEPTSWEIALEPDNQNADSIYKPTGTGTLLQKTAIIQANILAARAALDAAGHQAVYLVAPSCVNSQTALNWLIAWQAGNPDVIKALGLLSYHRYSSSGDSVIKAIGDFAASVGIPTGMTEFDKATYGNLNSDITLANCRVWQRYGVCGGNGAPLGSPWFWFDGTSIADNTNTPMTAQGRLLFSQVDMDAVRIGCTVSDTSKPPIAYQNPDGSLLVVRNAGGAFNLAGLPPGAPAVETWAKPQGLGDGGPINLTVGGDGNVLVQSPPGGGSPIAVLVMGV